MFKRIGIYSGTFDPIHVGHVAFALQALELAKLDQLYFMPERRPRAKAQVEHFAHRVAMLKQATKPYPKLKVLELTDINFSVERTLPKLRRLFKGDSLVFLFGSDVAKNLSDWPNIDRLTSTSELVIGLRSGDQAKDIQAVLSELPLPPTARVIKSYAPTVSSFSIRQALRQSRQARGSLRSVERYSNQHWLYVSLSH
jgi:nicotinate-nucleotide adenylyltransferase